MTPGLQIETEKEYHIVRWLVLFVFASVLVAVGYFGFKWYTTGTVPPVPLPASAMADARIDETPVTQEQVQAHVVPADQPRYITIPTLDIKKARVQSVGLTENNLLDTPKNIDDTAWFDKSANPGTKTGAVVIDGHNGGVSRNGVFATLSHLEQGDEIIIERGDGKEVIYAVETNETMSLEKANTTGMKDMMKSVDPSKQGLSLITCAGNWIPRDKVFDKRVMIRAVEVN